MNSSIVWRIPCKVIFCTLAVNLVASHFIACLAVAESEVTGPQVTGSEATGPVDSESVPNFEKRESDEAVPKELPKVRFNITGKERGQLIDEILAEMTLEEKIGQVQQSFPGGSSLSDDLASEIRAGRVGSIFYSGHEELVRDAQRVAVEESRLGIPLIVARDVIHGFRTMFPIPLGQAASWNPELVEAAARISANESRRVGIHWTFAPMIDITRDPRWGRIAESPGEDPYLASEIGVAMVKGFQSSDAQGRPQGVAACVKHYVAYGMSEGGRDYNRALVSRNELRNVFMPPFKACIDADSLTLMTAFNTVNGIPATGHRRLVREILKEEWGFSGLVVSDWGTVFEMIKHGSVPTPKRAAEVALDAGLDMEMVSTCMRDHLPNLVRSGRVSEDTLDQAVSRILETKIRLGLFSQPYADEQREQLLSENSLETAQQLARESMVLLKNESVLPLDSTKLKKLAVIGPFAEAPKDQLGTWTMDGKASDSVTPLKALTEKLGNDCEIIHVPCLSSKSHADHLNCEAALAAAEEADVVLLFVGEEESLSGEAHSRAQLGLPGSQDHLVDAIGKLEVPSIMVVSAGRPLTIGPQIEQVDAVLYGWQAGTMMGPALVDLLLGKESPSGKLPVTFPKNVGQIPLYYNHPMTGRPAGRDYRPVPLDEVKNLNSDVRYQSHYIDSDPFPLFPFGYGLSYSEFHYGDLKLSTEKLKRDQSLKVSVMVSNVGELDATEVVQLYVRDLFASVVRPVKELKGFRRVPLKAGESVEVEFTLTPQRLGFYNEDEQFLIEPGRFKVWVGGDSEAELSTHFMLE